MPSKESAIKKAQAQTGTSSSSVTAVPSKKITNSFGEVFGAFSTTYNDYTRTLTPRLKLIDLFLVFLVALGILQFVYVILVGDYPFNAFLGGFISCVGQFVLLVSLRLQIKSATVEQSEAKVAEKVDAEVVEAELEAQGLFEEVSTERAFFDFVFASLILHFFVFHFIN